MNQDVLVISVNGVPTWAGSLGPRESVRLGRGKNCEVVLPESRVAREHLVVRREGDGFVLEDTARIHQWLRLGAAPLKQQQPIVSGMTVNGGQVLVVHFEVVPGSEYAVRVREDPGRWSILPFVAQFPRAPVCDPEAQFRLALQRGGDPYVLARTLAPGDETAFRAAIGDRDPVLGRLADHALDGTPGGLDRFKRLVSGYLELRDATNLAPRVERPDVREVAQLITTLALDGRMRGRVTWVTEFVPSDVPERGLLLMATDGSSARVTLRDGASAIVDVGSARVWVERRGPDWFAAPVPTLDRAPIVVESGSFVYCGGGLVMFGFVRP